MSNKHVLLQMQKQFKNLHKDMLKDPDFTNVRFDKIYLWIRFKYKKGPRSIDEYFLTFLTEDVIELFSSRTSVNSLKRFKSKNFGFGTLKSYFKKEIEIS